tara:strand:+ start:178 stop:933 length:756 start_codon:yes stop_codon:yes gene_type:complete
MEKILLKKSYQLNSLKKIKYDHLWGTKGIFTTIRLIGNLPNYILLSDHIKKFNKSIKIFKIDFILSKDFLFKALQSNLNIKKYDHLLRIAINKKKISISLRKRQKPNKKFSVVLKNYQRSLPNLKNLKYKKILNMQKNINMKNEEIIFYNKGKLLEGSTTNIILYSNDKFIIPSKNYYVGITLSYFIKKMPSLFLVKDISLDQLSLYKEIILVGSGKGVISIASIKSINWYRSSTMMYKKLLKVYDKLLKE